MLDQLINFDSNNVLSSITSMQVYIVTLFSMLANGILNIPSSQIYYLTLGYVSNVNNFNLHIAILSGVIGNTLGNYILYFLVLNNDTTIKKFVYRYTKLDSSKIDSVLNSFAGKWWGYLILGKIIPSIKVFIPYVVGIIKLNKKKAFTIFFVGSLVWAYLLTYAGMHFGKDMSLTRFYLTLTLIYIFLGLILTKHKKN